MIFIGGWGTKFKFFRIIFNFLISNSLKRSDLYSNDQNYIQIMKFKFKQFNKKTTPHYRPLIPVPDSSTISLSDSSTQIGSTNARTHRTETLSPRPKQGIPPGVLTLATPGRAPPLSCWNQLSSSTSCFRRTEDEMMRGFTTNRIHMFWPWRPML
jgi:hypothetical protein